MQPDCRSMEVVAGGGGREVLVSSAMRSFTCDSRQNAIKSFGRSQYCTSLSIKLNRFFFFFYSIQALFGRSANRRVNRCAHILRALFNGVQVILATWKLIFFYSILLFQLTSVAGGDGVAMLFLLLQNLFISKWMEKRTISIIPKKVIVSIYKWNYPQNGATVPFSNVASGQSWHSASAHCKSNK